MPVLALAWDSGNLPIDQITFEELMEVISFNDGIASAHSKGSKGKQGGEFFGGHPKDYLANRFKGKVNNEHK